MTSLNGVKMNNVYFHSAVPGPCAKFNYLYIQFYVFNRKIED